MLCYYINRCSKTTNRVSEGHHKLELKELKKDVDKVFGI